MWCSKQPKAFYKSRQIRLVPFPVSIPHGIWLPRGIKQEFVESFDLHADRL